MTGGVVLFYKSKKEEFLWDSIWEFMSMKKRQP